QSVLDAIPGIGATIRTSLLKTLGSARRVRAASVAELAAVPKVTPKLAQRIYDHFHPADGGNPAEPSAVIMSEPGSGPEGGDVQ
ncbi:MAG: excinuclease ABC subunit C, partial [Candidatus Rokubacteria bacterium]|nr:excinuclease ABC subunit C [Candidatus Rokubacteria bacterium]